MPGRLSPMQVKFIKLPALIKRSGPPSTVTSGSANPSNVQTLTKNFQNLPTTDSFTCCPIGGVVETWHS